MTDSKDFDGDATDDLGEGEQDSPVIKQLRDQLKAKDQELKGTKAERDALAKGVAEVREASIKGLVNDLGFPGLAEIVAERLDGPPSEESVESVLVGLGLEPKPKGDVIVNEQPPAADPARVQAAASLGQRVGDAARGSSVNSLKERLEKAESQEEIQALMAEAGLTQSS